MNLRIDTMANLINWINSKMTKKPRSGNQVNQSVFFFISFTQSRLEKRSKIIIMKKKTYKYSAEHMSPESDPGYPQTL